MYPLQGPDDAPGAARWRLLIAGPGDPGEHALVARLRRSNAFELRTLSLCKNGLCKNGPSESGQAQRSHALPCTLATASTLIGRMRGYEAALLDAPAADVVRLAPWMWAASRVRRTPFVVRVRSGRLVHELARLSARRRSTCQRALAAAGLLLLRERDDLAPFADLGTARWLPACGVLPEPGAPHAGARASGCRRLLVACDALDARDVAGLLAASDTLPEGATLTLAGTRDRAPVALHARAAWIGVEGARDLERLIDEHDALVEPDPGPDDDARERIVRALQAGHPVVAGLGGDSDLYVAHDVAGLLVAPRAYAELGRALSALVLDPALYARLAHGARAAGRRFDAHRWNEELADWLFQVCDQGAISRTLPFYEREERASALQPERSRGAGGERRGDVPGGVPGPAARPA